jgi:segregation and condensation protein B
MIKRFDGDTGQVRDEGAEHGQAERERALRSAEAGSLEELAAEVAAESGHATESTPAKKELGSEEDGSSNESRATAVREAGPDTEPDAEPDAESDAEPDAESDAEADAEPDAESETPEEASVEAELGPAASPELVESLPDGQGFRDPEGEDRPRLLAAIEALLFASPEALSNSRLSEILAVGVGVVKDALEELGERLDAEERPYQLVAFGPGWRLFTRKEFYPYLLRLRSIKKVEKLTPAALETLAIVAYRQPVIRADVEAIRGVKVGPMLRALMDRKLVRVLGRAEVPGAPLQYGTTQRFLDRFGLASLSDLPSLKEFKQGRI